MDKQIYTYDIWDTILKRNCHPAYTLEFTIYWLLIYIGKNEHYEHVCNALKTKERELFNIKKEYYIHDLIVNILQDNKLIEQSEKKDIIELWNQIYLFVEKKCTYKNDYVINIIKNDMGEKFFISDFYTDSDFIKSILKHHSVEISKGITSAEYESSKHTGLLYEKLEVLNGKKWIHTGDNFLADVKMAKAWGAETRYIKNKHLKRVTYKPGNDYERLAFILLSFSLFILTMAKKECCNKIYFFTREGVFFKTTFDLLIKELPSLFQSLKTEILPISRVASLVLKFNSFDEFWGFKDALHQYGYNTSVFLSFFNFQELYPELVNKYEDVRDIFKNRNDPLVKELIINIENKKKRTEKYLEIIGFDIEPSIIVDIGWRGSIQDNLMSRPSNNIRHGCYLGLFKFYDGQSGISKSSIIFDNNINNCNWSKKGVSFMETIFNHTDGSVVDYQHDKPVKKENDIEKNNFNKLAEMQSSIIESYNNLLYLLLTGRINVKDINNLAIRSYKKIVTNPSKDLADFYIDSIQNESFGLDCFIRKDFNITGNDFLHCLLSRGKRNNIRDKLLNNGWRESIIKSSKTSICAKLFSLIIR
uniref:Glycosyl transferase n=1 Tax=Salmonella enterica TaxID=28901 RepID=U3GKQ0_SALER|nr:glycosyl transferase [Salmonella enterica]